MSCILTGVYCIYFHCMLHFQCSMKETHMLKERELITKLEMQLPQLLPPAFTLGSFKSEVRIKGGGRIDILAVLNSPVLLEPIQFAIEVKTSARLSSMLEAAYQVKRYAQAINAIPVVASNFLGERTRDLLKKENVSYMDLAGNFYLNLPNIYAEKVVDKNPFSNSPPLKNIFSPISSRITRAMLKNPIKEWGISELSSDTGVSIGQTYNVLKAMLDEALVVKADEKWRPKDPTTLIDAWKEFYPKYKTRKYTFFSYAPNTVPNMVRDAAERSKLPYALGFFSGVNMVAPFIRGINKVQFYTDEASVEKWRDALQLKEVQGGGNVEIYVPYDKGVLDELQWLPPRVQDTPVVSNIQLYMDLFNNPARGEEAADYLRKEKIGF